MGVSFVCNGKYEVAFMLHILEAFLVHYLIHLELLNFIFELEMFALQQLEIFIFLPGK